MDLQATQTNTKTTQNNNSSNNNGNGKGKTSVFHQTQIYNEEIDSSCSTPYVSAPSSPSRTYNNGFFYSAPASPMHFTISSSKIPNSISSSADSSSSMSGFDFEFDFSARLFPNSHDSSTNNGSMSSADELFLNGQIRPMKLSSHLQRPQRLAPLIDLDFENEDDEIESEDNGLDKVELLRGRDLRNRTSSLRRRTRSLSPLRNSPPFLWPKHGFQFEDENEKPNEFHLGDEKNQNDDLVIEEIEEKQSENENRACSVTGSGSSSRSSSAGRSSKRWVFLKEFLYRSKSEGRSSSVKFWSPVAKEKKPISNNDSKSMGNNVKKTGGGSVVNNGKPVNGVGKRRVPPPSPHELHYTANRAQAEEMRKKTFLPYKQGLLGCLGFSSKGYGAMNGFARALNPVSSR